MDYIVTRRNQKTIKNISTNNIKELNLSLDEYISFTIYGNSSNWSKKGSHSITPVGYVIVTDLEYVFPPSILLPLLSQSNGIPLLFAIITPTGHVYLEEFTDALISLDWTLPVGLSPTTIKNDTPSTQIIEIESLQDNNFQTNELENNTNTNQDENYELIDEISN